MLHAFRVQRDWGPYKTSLRRLPGCGALSGLAWALLVDVLGTTGAEQKLVCLRPAHQRALGASRCLRTWAEE